MLLFESFMRILKLTRIIELFKGGEEYWDSVPIAYLSDCGRMLWKLAEV